MTDREKQIQALKILGLTEEDVADVLESDRRIDKGEKLFELPEELEKGAKKARNAGNCKGYTKPQKVTKKPDEDKLEIMGRIKDNLKYWFKTDGEKVCSNFVTINHEREITFEVNGKKYKIVLSCPRS